VLFASGDLAQIYEFITPARLTSETTVAVMDPRAVVLARWPNPEKWVGHYDGDFDACQYCVDDHTLECATCGVAHDFNNFLTAILGYSDFLAGRLNPADSLRKDVEEIRRAATRAAELTQQLSAFSRRQMLQPKVLDLNTVVADMGKMLRRLIGEDIDLVTVLTLALGKIKADPSQISQVIISLAVNARDAMPRGGKLTIETANVASDEAPALSPASAPSGSYVMLAVSDTGAGMNAETQSHIFEPFLTTKEQGKGTGLGLSTVYGIVKQSGGHIYVSSELNRGTEFFISSSTEMGKCGSRTSDAAKHSRVIRERLRSHQ